MRLRHVVFFVAPILALAASANAQGASSRFEVAFFPNSHLRVTEGGTSAQRGFRAYTPGGAVAFTFNDYLGVEADLSGGRGSTQAPAMTAIAGGAIVNLAPYARVRPYAAAGIGSIHMFRRTELGMAHGETFDAANVGGGVKVMFTHWGLRADYRFVGMDSTSSDRSAFIGPGTRHAHRLSLGIVIASSRPVK